LSFYLDTSALVKLVVSEPQSDALQIWLTDEARQAVACDLVRTELARAVRRAAPEHVLRARTVLDAVTLLQVTPAVFDAAARLDPVGLRTLDAVHLASALDLGDELEGLVTYDERLAEAARSNGVPVFAPG